MAGVSLACTGCLLTVTVLLFDAYRLHILGSRTQQLVGAAVVRLVVYPADPALLVLVLAGPPLPLGQQLHRACQLPQLLPAASV
jgi:hypothetical protein